MPSFTSASTPSRMSLPGRETICGNDLHQELVAVSGRAAIVGLEDEPSVGGGQRGPFVPVGLEVVAVGIGGAAVNQGEHGQMLRLQTFPEDRSACLRPWCRRRLSIGRACLAGDSRSAKSLVERRDRAGLIEFVGGIGQINFAGLAERRVDEGHARRMQRGRDLGVRAGPVGEPMQFVGGLGWRTSGLQYRGARRSERLSAVTA